MGLSSKQVSSRGVDWNHTLLEDQNLELPKATPMKKQQQSQQLEAVNCPRCDSTNTKFCYYNNYNKSQPRHFCRACKRHWTKGGTLRNVPVGGVRKNKRVKKSTSPTSISTSPKTTISTSTSNANMTYIQTSQQKQNKKTTPSSMYESLIHPPSSLPPQNLMSTKDQSEGNREEFGIGNDMFLSSSSMSFPQNQSFIFPFSNSSSLRSSNAYNYGEEFKIMEESTINNSAMPSTSGSGTITQPWEIPATSSGMDMSNYWSWEDIDSLVSTDLNVPWDDSDIKP